MRVMLASKAAWSWKSIPGVSKMFSVTVLRFGVAESSAVAQVMAEVGRIVAFA